jgi:hypothetical protein
MCACCGCLLLALVPDGAVLDCSRARQIELSAQREVADRTVLQAAMKEVIDRGECACARAHDLMRRPNGGHVSARQAWKAS